MTSDQSKRGGKQNRTNAQATSHNKQFFVVGFLFAVLAICICLIQYRFYLITYSSSEYSPSLFEVDIDDASKSFDGDKFKMEKIYTPPLWGTLNSGHYFGMKLSSPDSLETSLVWFMNKLNKERRLDLRHLCDQNNNLKSYSWTKHDFYNFGQQKIEDGAIKLTTGFIKNPDNPNEWQAKISVENISNSNHSYISFIQYVTINHKQDRVDIVSAKNKLTQNSEINVNLFDARGKTRETGSFKFTIDLKTNSENFIYGNFFRGNYDKRISSISDFLHSRMIATKLNNTMLYVLPGSVKTPSFNFDDQQDDMNEPNIIAYQLIVKAPTTFTLNFAQHSHVDSSIIDYDDALRTKVENFDQKFDQTFPFMATSESNKSSRMTELGKVALSNMLGSIGYFHGTVFINSNLNPNKIVPYGPVQLLTAVPSRSFFPRGFLWDEGFHNILISEWDPSISNKIIDSWFNLMNKNGWIPREIILGLESMRRVPEEFIVQRISNANPPTMFLVIEKMLDENSLQQETLKNIYPRLLAWFNWFNSTQLGLKPSTYRWRGRDELSVYMLNPKTLTSGLDDYPRASHPSEHEYHIDLRCWMALAARTLLKIAEMLNDLETSKEMSAMSNQLHDNDLLDKLHWSNEHKLYCDFGHSTESSELVKVTKTRTLPNGKVEKYQTLERHSKGKLTFGCVPEFGYVSLFPLMLKVIDQNNQNLKVILDRLEDEKELWSPCGVRSLSKLSRYYNKYNTEDDKPYWRGAIWINMNYLLLQSLRHYSQLDGPYKTKCEELFHKLRQNLVDNILEQFDKTGYLWENYDDNKCKGTGSHPFTGWTSLILMIMSSKI